MDSSLQIAPVLAELIARAPLNELGPGRAAAAPQELESLDLATAIDQPIVDRQMAKCVLAGLWLLFDDLDRSHELSQSIDTPSGSYWHGIMHRREPDYGNAKYWFRAVGRHPVFEPLLSEAREIARQHPGGSADALVSSEQWDPFAFVDLCAAAARGGGDLEQLCRLVQRRECELLLEHCLRGAIGE